MEVVVTMNKGEYIMQRLNQDIKDHTFKRVYCLFGEEEYLKRSYKKRLIEAISGDDQASHCRGFSCCRAQALGQADFRS